MACVQDYSKAAGDPNQQWLATQGITLTNYHGTTHPSEPNYCAAAAGDNFGMDNDDFHQIPANISTVVDLLDTKGISWAEYQEAMPYTGFQGFNFSNQTTYANDYVRKHNPLVLFDSVTNNATRLSLIKNFTGFYNDLDDQVLPQWAFITPNMTDDGHDTTVTFASVWERNWIAPLLNNSYFMNNTLILLTFDEDETYAEDNSVFSILLGGVIPDELKGTVDNTFYNHYSTIASVSANWGLPSLGRWDCGANIFQIVANQTGYQNVDIPNPAAIDVFFNASYPGPVSDEKWIPTWPVPATNVKCSAGNGVLASVNDLYGNQSPTYNYSTSAYPYDDVSLTNVANTTVTTTTSTNSSSTSSGASATKSSGASIDKANLMGMGVVAAAGIVALAML